MRVQAHGQIPEETFRHIESEISDHQNLKAMMFWALSQPVGTFSPQVVAQVIVQDEFTHDVIVPRSDGLVLVYDST